MLSNDVHFALGKQVFIGGVCGAKNYADKKKATQRTEIRTKKDAVTAIMGSTMNIGVN
jgi:hypothetical protein